MSTPEVKRLFWLAVLALIIAAAISALAIWCATRPLVSFPLQPKKAAMSSPSRVLPCLALFLPLSTPAVANGDCAFASLASDRPVVPGRRDLFRAVCSPALVTNPSGGAMAPAAFSVRAIRTAPAVCSRRKVVSGDLPPEGVIFDITQTTMAAAWLSDFRSARMAVSLASREGAHV